MPNLNKKTCGMTAQRARFEVTATSRKQEQSSARETSPSNENSSESERQEYSSSSEENGTYERSRLRDGNSSKKGTKRSFSETQDSQEGADNDTGRKTVSSGTSSNEGSDSVNRNVSQNHRRNVQKEKEKSSSLQDSTPGSEEDSDDHGSSVAEQDYEAFEGKTGESIDDNEDTPPSIKAKREYNRKCAAKSREKRKKTLVNLQKKVNDTSKEFEALEMTNRSLRSEILELLKSHGLLTSLSLSAEGENLTASSSQVGLLQPVDPSVGEGNQNGASSDSVRARGETTMQIRTTFNTSREQDQKPSAVSPRVSASIDEGTQNATSSSNNSAVNLLEQLNTLMGVFSKAQNVQKQPQVQSQPQQSNQPQIQRQTQMQLSSISHLNQVTQLVQQLVQPQSQTQTQQNQIQQLSNTLINHGQQQGPIAQTHHNLQGEYQATNHPRQQSTDSRREEQKDEQAPSQNGAIQQQPPIRQQLAANPNVQNVSGDILALLLMQLNAANKQKK